MVISYKSTAHDTSAMAAYEPMRGGEDPVFDMRALAELRW